jgi:tRNA (guanosine-2'-O-)-methyltransferase
MPTARRRDRIRTVAAARQAGLVVVLEDIHDPHNAEAVFRSCDAFGAQNVHLVFEQEAPFNPRRVGKLTSASANKWLTFRTYRSIGDCLTTLRTSGYVLMATDPNHEGSSVADVNLTVPKLALLFGNEHRGLSEAALAAADSVIRIATVGMVPSLNLSVAAAVCLYEVTRQRSAVGGDHRIPTDAREELMVKWLDCT